MSIVDRKVLIRLSYFALVDGATTQVNKVVHHIFFKAFYNQQLSKGKSMIEKTLSRSWRKSSWSYCWRPICTSFLLFYVIVYLLHVAQFDFLWERWRHWIMDDLIGNRKLNIKTMEGGRMNIDRNVRGSNQLDTSFF